MAPDIERVLDKHLPLRASLLSSSSNDADKHAALQLERKKDHYSHFIVRLAFSRSEELRKRFLRAETALFKVRWMGEEEGARSRFVRDLGLRLEIVSDEECRQLSEELSSVGGKSESNWFKVEWERVSDLIERRQCFVRKGKAYVPGSMQGSLIFNEFSAKLEAALEQTSRALPRLDEDDRLLPILNHMSLGFGTIDTSSNAPITSMGELKAGQIDSLISHFPLCMRTLHVHLRQHSHLKHFGRLQYTLFLKGVGLSVDEALIFWRSSFRNLTDDKFNKEYRYNVRHAYGLEGNRRNYKPKSCLQIISENPPGPADTHGCPYRHFSTDNLVIALSQMGVNDQSLIKAVKTDIERKGYHVACNRVLEFTRRQEIKREKDAGMYAGETITTPNEYFERSWRLTHPEEGEGDTAMKE